MNIENSTNYGQYDMVDLLMTINAVIQEGNDILEFEEPESMLQSMLIKYAEFIDILTLPSSSKRTQA